MLETDCLKAEEDLEEDWGRSKRPGRPKKIEELLEQTIVQLFLSHVDMTAIEVLEWLREEFGISVVQQTISNVLNCHNISYKRLKSVAARHFMLNQEAPGLWLDAINAAEATIHSFHVSLFHLLTIQEPPGQDRGRGRRASR